MTNRTGNLSLKGTEAGKSEYDKGEDRNFLDWK